MNRVGMHAATNKLEEMRRAYKLNYLLIDRRTFSLGPWIRCQVWTVCVSTK